MKTKLASRVAQLACIGRVCNDAVRLHRRQPLLQDRVVHLLGASCSTSMGAATCVTRYLVEPGLKVIRVQGPAAPGFLYGDIRDVHARCEAVHSLLPEGGEEKSA